MSATSIRWSSLVDDFLQFAGGRAQPNTVRAYAHDLKTFFSVVAKDPVDVRAEDVFGFISRGARGAVVATFSAAPPPNACSAAAGPRPATRDES